MDRSLDIIRDGAVATVWMSRPDRHNAFDEDLITGLAAAFSELAADDRVRVVVLGGRGRSFSAGADLNWMRRAAEAGAHENLADARRLADMLRALAEMPKPTIARVHGAALGGGMGLACACDLCIASEEAVFATTEVRLGLIPAVIGPYVIRAIGERQALRYFQTAERIPAARARELGIAHEVVAGPALDARIGEIVAALLEGGPLAQAAAKQLVGAAGVRAVTEATLEDTARRIAGLRTTAEAKEGLAAFLEKRPPAWATKKG